MSVWIIEPRDTLLVRDGRPFGAFPGARARSLSFPFPSTTAGVMRTRAGQDPRGGFDVGMIQTVLEIGVRGPFIVELDENGEISNWLFPAPSDAILLESENRETARLVRAAPLGTTGSSLVNLPQDLQPVGSPQVGVARRLSGPAYWYWQYVEEWLLGEKPPLGGERRIKLADLGHDGPVAEERTHVAVLRETMTAREGALFQTRGLSFSRSVPDAMGAQIRRLALAVSVDNPTRATISEGVLPAAGERRLAYLRQSEGTLPLLQPELKSRIVRDRHCRLILATPAYFSLGCRPDGLNPQSHDVRVSVRAMTLPRCVVVSGWDLARRAPKPTRRLAPAGTTLFLALEGSEAALQSWVDSVWLQGVSDRHEDNLAGFGVALLGGYDGATVALEE